MPIEELPASLVRTIGSAQSLTDSASLVKELIENAIDAKATAISVETSANALDRFQVKDNGHGIASEDRALACTRYCTSKIQNLDDLRSIGGTSLGFRGEALASAITMSGTFKLTTRTQADDMATEYGYDVHCKIISEKRVSQPVGTTVTIHDFLEHLPVRKQTAKNTKYQSAQLAKIKRLLCSYALSHPNLRLALVITKANSEKSHWTYAPSPSSSAADKALPRSIIIPDAVTKLFGTKLASQCEFVSWDTSTEARIAVMPASEHASFEQSSFLFEAFVPKPDMIEFASIPTPRQFMSIDQRPVSCARGTPKQLSGRFKRLLKAKRAEHGSTTSIDPFLWLNIRCPPCSYDANIEPAKDDVLFHDAEKLLNWFDEFLKDIYGPCNDPNQPESPQHTPRHDNFDLLLSRDNPIVNSPRNGPTENARNYIPTTPITPARRQMCPNSSPNDRNTIMVDSDVSSSDSDTEIPARQSQSTNNNNTAERHVAQDRPLDYWFKKGPMSNLPLTPTSNGPGLRLEDIPVMTSQSGGAYRSRKVKAQVSNQLFISPVNDPKRVWFETGLVRTSSSQTQTQLQAQRQYVRPQASTLPWNISDMSRTMTSSPGSSMHPDLAATMEYEVRKAQAGQNYRAEQLRLKHGLTSSPGTPDDDAQTITPTSKSPHRNRMLNAKAALQTPQSTQHSSSTGTPLQSKARLSYWTSLATRHGNRNNTTIGLPLERVRETDTVRKLCLNILIDEDDIESQYTSSQALTSPKDDIPFTDLTDEEISTWTTQITTIASQLIHGCGVQSTDLDLALIISRIRVQEALDEYNDQSHPEPTTTMSSR